MKHFTYSNLSPRQQATLAAAAVALAAVTLLALIHGFTSARAADGSATQASGPLLVHKADRIEVPANSPLRQRLAVSAIANSAAAHSVALPAVVEADPARTVNILPPLTGRLVALKVKLGDVVKQGQVLAVISSPDLAQAYADVDKARDALELARRAQERARGVSEAGGTAAKDLEQIASTYAQAQAEARRAEARLAVLGGSGADKSRSLSISAPMSGIVTALNSGHGSYLNDPNAALMTIANLDQVWVTANVPENLVGAVAKGQAADVSLPAYPALKLRGTVSVVSAVLEADTRRNKTRIAFANPDGKLKPNMFATVNLAIAQGPQVTVPASALLMNNDSTTVFVEVQPWVFERRVVELGSEDGDSVRVVSGLAAGERVVVRGGVLLND
jgi:cobalt-zinc-cadmium efflux system membrane fusion protein